jgi:transcriptional regulator with GAF, ATPase, and Fis domain
MRMNAGMIGESPAMKLLTCQINTVASCDLAVLISGETGTGKELVARAIHEQSARSPRPFVSINCGALTDSLMESELFGSERGAFTGAHQRRKGLFEAANGGTILLDEIGEMPLSSQAKLLRVLQEHRVRPVGARHEIEVDVRLITATNRKLIGEIAAGRFREDLFYRIAVLSIETPPLRERLSDIPLLVCHFQDLLERKLASNLLRPIQDSALQVLQVYAWPGNVRQLRHVVEQLVVDICRNQVIDANAVHRALWNQPDGFPRSANNAQPFTYIEGESLDDFLDRTLLELYDATRARLVTHAETARHLCVDRVALYSRLRRARQRIREAREGGVSALK